MPYEFAEHEFELEPDASGARSGDPPRKLTGIGILDPAVPPKRAPTSLLLRVLGGLILLGLTAGILFLLFGRH